MPVTTITQQGAFSADVARQINNNFAALNASAVVGELAAGAMLVGDAEGVATAVEMSGDVTMTSAGVTAIKTSVSLTTPVLGAATGTSLVLSGNCRAATFNAGATAGATAGPFTTVASIQTIGGIVTVLTGS